MTRQEAEDLIKANMDALDDKVIRFLYNIVIDKLNKELYEEYKEWGELYKLWIKD